MSAVAQVRKESWTYRVADVGALHETRAEEQPVLADVCAPVSITLEPGSHLRQFANKGKMPTHVRRKDACKEDLAELGRLARFALIEQEAKAVQLEHPRKGCGVEVLKDGLAVVYLRGWCLCVDLVMGLSASATSDRAAAGTHHVCVAQSRVPDIMSDSSKKQGKHIHGTQKVTETTFFCQRRIPLP